MGRNSPGRVFDRVLIIMFENQSRSYVFPAHQAQHRRRPIGTPE